MVILLTGPDLYRSHRRLTVLREAFRRKYDASGFATSTIDGSMATTEDIRNAIGNQGLFSRKRFVAVDQLGQNAILDMATLNELLVPITDDESTIVVLRQIETKRKAPLRKSKAKSKKPSVTRSKDIDVRGMKTEVFNLLTPAELRSWVIADAKERGGKINQSAAERLAAACQNDTWRIASELEKLLAYVGDQAITPEDVETMVHSPVESNIFAVTDAVGQGQRARALAILHQELLAGTHPLVLVATIAQHLRTLIMVKTASGQKIPPAEIAGVTGVHPYVVQKSLGQIQNFSLEQLGQWHHRLVSVDHQLKSSSLDGETLLDLVLLDRG